MYPNQLDIYAQLLARAHNRTFDDILGLKLLSHLANALRLSVKGKGQSPGTDRAVDDRQVTDQLVRHLLCAS